MKTSIIKALTYRLFGTLVTAGLTLYFTHRWQFVGLIGGADFVVKVAAYFVHEEFWRHRRLLKISVSVPSCGTGTAKIEASPPEKDPCRWEFDGLTRWYRFENGVQRACAAQGGFKQWVAFVWTSNLDGSTSTRVLGEFWELKFALAMIDKVLATESTSAADSRAATKAL